jgi:DNA-binding transcriptional ArsR family regulator
MLVDMASWVSSDEPVLRTAIGTARELADPIRLTVLQLLAHEGPHGGLQLADILQVAQPRLANHLKRLHDAGLISIERQGRHAVYRIADDRLPPLLDALAEFAGGPLPTPTPAVPAFRTCYDHAAGPWAVAVLADLRSSGALTPADGDRLDYGPNAATALAAWDIDIATIHPGRRALATQCLDRTVRRPHLGGALGAALLESATRNGWLPDAES